MAWASINTGTLSFGTFTFDAAAITWLGVWDQESTPNFLGKIAITNTSQNDPAVGAMVSLTQNKVKLQLPRGTLTEKGAGEALKGLVHANRTISAHSGDPGITGANEINADGDDGYARVDTVTANWEISEQAADPYP